MDRETDERNLSAALARAIAPDWPAQVECRVCGHAIETAAARRFCCEAMFTDARLVRLQCPMCDAVFGPWSLVSMPEQDLGELYRLLYRVYSEGNTVTWQEKAFYLLNPSRIGTYLNYACGEWTIGLQRLRAIGWNVWGYEPFLNQERCKSDARLGLVDNLTSIECSAFDGIFTHNYLEHPQNPQRFLQTLHGLLKRGGAMVHSTPCFELMYDGSPFHLYFFLGRSFDVLCQRTGFEVVERLESDRAEADAFTAIARCRKVVL